MSKQIDLRLIAACYQTDATGLVSPSELMALVAAVRAARAFVFREGDVEAMLNFAALEEVLSDFTDSAEDES